METQDFAVYAEPALKRLGLAADELELSIMASVEQVYGPSLYALLAADLSEVGPENDLDPARAPRR